MAAALQTLDQQLPGDYDALFADHVAEWGRYWQNSDVLIDGDELAQKALRFTTYHVLISAPRHDEHVSIGAKTLSGPGYKGHVFWDTELFIVPLLTLTQPRLARNLLMYRYHTLQGARNKAKEGGYEGAMYAWESTDTGEETTPRWTNPAPDGSRIRIWTGDSEQHISTDIAYAILQYWHWTNDVEFFVHYGAEIVLDTAVFWGSRAEYKADKGRYELNEQIGPDEYHENINNSVFTNSVVRWHLGEALDTLDWLRVQYPQQAAELITRLGLTTDRLEKWRDIIARMYIPQDTQRGASNNSRVFSNWNRSTWHTGSRASRTSMRFSATNAFRKLRRSNRRMWSCSRRCCRSGGRCGRAASQLGRVLSGGRSRLVAQPIDARLGRRPDRADGRSLRYVHPRRDD